MLSDTGNQPSSNQADEMAHTQRRGSITSSAFSSFFRNNSVSQVPPVPFATPLATAAMSDHRRRMSVAAIGLSGTSPTTPSALLRRASLSTNDSSIDESAVDDDEPRPAAPPFPRRMSFGAATAAQAMRSVRGPTSPGLNGRQQPQSPATPTTPTTPTAASIMMRRGSHTWEQIMSSAQALQTQSHQAQTQIQSQASTATLSRTSSNLFSSSPARSDQGFNWSDQLRSRAESTVSGAARASFSFPSASMAGSPPRPPMPAPQAAVATAGVGVSPRHDRAKSVSDMPAPPAQPPKPRQPQKPDHFQERILKGDFYMD